MSIIIYVAVLAALVLLTGGVLTVWPSLDQAVLTGDEGRKHALDGTRGILALSVMIHHLLLLHLFVMPITDDRPLRANPFVNQLGSGSVALFFMISAYLFGGRLLERGGRLDVIGFAVNRITRIVPLYATVILLVTFVCVAVQDFRLVEPASTVLIAVGRDLLFNFVPLGPINGVSAARDMLGPVWSLKYEWLLYAEIPLMALLFRRSGWTLLLYVPLIASVRLFHDGRFYFFVAGLAAAQLAALHGRRTATAWAVAGPAALAILLARYYACLSWQQAMLLIPLFVAIIQGRRWFALLGLRPLRFIGEISFSLYLLHMPVIYLTGALFSIRWRELSSLQFAAVALAIGVCVIALSCASFLLIERRFHVQLKRAKGRSSQEITAPPFSEVGGRLI